MLVRGETVLDNASAKSAHQSRHSRPARLPRRKERGKMYREKVPTDAPDDDATNTPASSQQGHEV